MVKIILSCSVGDIVYFQSVQLGKVTWSHHSTLQKKYKNVCISNDQINIVDVSITAENAYNYKKYDLTLQEQKVHPYGF